MQVGELWCNLQASKGQVGDYQASLGFLWRLTESIGGWQESSASIVPAFLMQPNGPLLGVLTLAEACDPHTVSATMPQTWQLSA